MKLSFVCQFSAEVAIYLEFSFSEPQNLNHHSQKETLSTWKGFLSYDFYKDNRKVD